MSQKSIQRVAVLTSGGDAPGMNAAIRAVVRTAIYHHIEIYGVYRGYEGLIEGDIQRLHNKDMANIIHRGGTVLKTARSTEFRTQEGRQKAIRNLRHHKIDGLIAIGGNGTLTGAQILHEESGIPIIGLPGTIDNDLYGTDLTIGYDTAVNTAIEAVDKIRDTADSHNRLFLIEVMGRHSGFLALHTGIGSGASDILIPEENESIDDILQVIAPREGRKKLFNLIIVAEGNHLGSAQAIADQLQLKLSDREVRVAIIGHLQRGGSPTALDRVLSSRLGHAAVRALLESQDCVMMGVVNSKITATPLSQAISQAKPIDSDLLQLAKTLAS